MTQLDFLDGILDKGTLRLLGSAALLYFYYQLIFEAGHSTAVVSSVVLLIYLALIWLPRSCWNVLTYTLASLGIVVAVLLLRYLCGVNQVSLMWPLVGILATLPRRYHRLSVILAIPTVVATLLLSRSSSFPWATLLGLFGLYAAIRARRMRQEAYQMSQLHLQELNQVHETLQKAHAELQQTTVNSMRYAALEERSRLAREIHDGLGHQLTSLIVQLQALKIMLPGDPDGASLTVPHLLDMARQAMAEVRMAVHEWARDEMGLGIVALRGLVSQVQARSPVDIQWSQADDISEWPMETSMVLYRVVQEALTNVLRHAQATIVTVRVEENNNHIELSIADNGTYAQDLPLVLGFGLNGMMERCRQRGGTCTLAAADPHGFCIQVVLPLETDIRKEYPLGTSISAQTTGG